MANPAFGKNLSFCGTSSRVFTRFVVALVIVNKYDTYVQSLVIIENPRKLREKRRGGPGGKGGGTRAQSSGVNWGTSGFPPQADFPWVQQTPPRIHKWRGGIQRLG